LERDIVGTEIKDNMEGKIVPVKAYCWYYRKAMKEVNIKPLIKPIRGGTDGCQLLVGFLS
jgi:tripeptide aminopeptidase